MDEDSEIGGGEVGRGEDGEVGEGKEVDKGSDERG